MEATAEKIDWLRAFYRAIDDGRYEEVADFLHEECRCQYPTGAVVEGRERIIELMRRSLSALAMIRHELTHVWQEEQELIFELEVTYGRSDGQEIVRPGCGVFVLEDGQIIEQRLFVDARGVWD